MSDLVGNPACCFSHANAYFRILDEQEALEDFRHADDDTDEKVSWNEYLKHEFNMNAKQMKQMKEKNDEKYKRVIAVSFNIN